MCGPKHFSIFFFALMFATWSAPAGRADEVLSWNTAALDLVQQSAANPPKAGRDVVIVQASVYDALNAIDQAYSPLYFPPAVTGPASREAAVAAAAHQALAGIACGREIGSDIVENCARPIPAPRAGILALLGAACLIWWRPRRP